MKYMDIDCYERGCACASSSRVAGDDTEVVEVVRFRELSADEILDLWVKKNNLNGAQDIVDFARAILKKASE